MTFTMNKKLQQGFTLIELLVVIAIIGILAAMVITNLRTAREKARDASAITSMSSARAEAENYYDETNLSYAGLCATGSYTPATTGTLTKFENLMVAAANANSQTVTCVVGGTNSQQYYAYTTLFTADTFCIDSSGFAGKIPNAPTGTECR